MQGFDQQLYERMVKTIVDWGDWMQFDAAEHSRRVIAVCQRINEDNERALREHERGDECHFKR